MRRPAGKIWFLVLLAFLLLLFVAGVSRFGHRSASGAASPFMAVSRSVSALFSGIWDSLFSDDGRKLEEYEVLLREAEVRIAGIGELAEENRQLRALLELPPVRGWEALYAQVVMRDPAVWNWSFRIGRGAADGIAVGAPVLFGSHLVGRVSEVFNRSANVSTLLNPSCTIGVHVISTGGVYPGILRGDGAMSGGVPSAVVDYLPKEAVIEDGARIVTSGLGTELPGGLPVGVVSGSGQVVDDARMMVKVIPGGDAGRMRFAVVMCRSGNEEKKRDGESVNPE